MLICDLCGSKDKVNSYGLSFEILQRDKEPIGTICNQDVCDVCHTKLYNMIHVTNNSPTLDQVLAKGLDCKQNITRTTNRGD